MRQILRILIPDLGQFQEDRFHKGRFIAPDTIFFGCRDQIRGIGFYQKAVGWYAGD